MTTLADIDIHTEGSGDDVVVMVHGWPDTYRLWDGQVAALKDHFRCVRFTLPGFDLAKPRRGYSLDDVVDVIRQVVDAASPGKPVTLMLHDWGCAFGYQYVMRHPDRVKRLVGVDIGDASSKRFLRSLSAKQKLMIFGYQSWLALAWALGPTLGDPMTRWMAKALHAPADRAYVSSHMNYPYYIQWTGAHGGYKGMKPLVPPCPMLFFYGTRKPFLFHSREWAQELAQRPGCQVVPLNAGHWVMLDQAKEFNQTVLNWLG